LHKSKLEEFAAYCESQGWLREPVKGDYEVLRMRQKGSSPLIVWDRLNAREHYTTEGNSEYMFSWWKKSKRLQQRQQKSEENST
jgi:hypothetical protein